jgi:hypothetical protein
MFPASVIIKRDAPGVPVDHYDVRSLLAGKWVNFDLSMLRSRDNKSQ